MMLSEEAGKLIDRIRAVQLVAKREVPAIERIADAIEAQAPQSVSPTRVSE